MTAAGSLTGDTPPPPTGGSFGTDGANAAAAVPPPAEDGKKPDGPLASAGEVFSFVRTRRMALNLALGLFFSVCSGCVMPATAWIFSDSFTNFAGDSTSADYLANIRELAFTFMVLGVYAFATMTLQATFMEMFAGEMATVMKKEWFAALMRQDMAYYDIMDVSGTATILGSNGKKFKKGVGRKLGEGVQFTITGIGGLAFGFWASWKLSLTILAIVPFMAITTAFLLKQNQTKTSRANESYSRAGSIVYSVVSSIRTILSLNAIEQVIVDFKEATEEAYKGAVGQVFFLGLANGSVMGSFLLAYLPLILYGSYLLYTAVEESGCDPSGAVPNNQACDPSAFGVFGALMGITFAGAVLPQISASLECFVGARSACYPALLAINRKLDDSETLAPKQDAGDSKPPMRRGSTAPLPKYVIDSSSPDGLKPRSVVGHIVFNNVGFCYPSRQEVKVFDGFNLDVKAGTTVALVGASGGGKSTVVQLLERFYDPTSGSVTLDGNDLTNLNVKWLRQQIGLVSQEPKLFAASILDNIRIGRPQATIDEVHAAARKSNCHDFIMSFAKGYDTPVGDQGAQLSGGQKQRIAIARTIVMDPKVYLLDEATSALDSESEVIVQEALDKLMEEQGEGSDKRTILVIAHRLSTIKNADMIAVVSGGKVVETGKHAELIAQKGAYFDLVEAQKGNKKTVDSESGELSRSASIADGMSDFTAATQKKEEKDDLLTFDDVHFHYPSRPEQEIFRGLNLSVKDGETLAIVGPSGQGKSTIVQLVEKFYLPTKGTMRYKGVDFNDLNVGWLHTQVGLVGQEPHLFDISIAENIRFGLPNATMDEIIQAAKEANADGFIRSFPDGYNTMVGSSSSTQVSGGQKQRIAIARVLIRKPKILLLDEATSALDSESERIVQDALDTVMQASHRTTIIIAHRLSTIRNADRIVVINKGKVREIGTHDELMSLAGHYQRLVALQDLDGDTDRQNYKDEMKATAGAAAASTVATSLIMDSQKVSSEKPSKVKVLEQENAKKARRLAKGDEGYLLLGAIGAILAGLMFPGWGFMFAYMVDLLFYPVEYCDESMAAPPPFPYESCQQYWDSVSEDMRELSFKISYALVGIMASAMIGHTLVHVGFGTATERMNKRVRDASFGNLVRQEVAYFDLRPVAVITSELSDDAAMIHAFSGEPIRTVVMNLASVLVGIVVSFVFMWPFALLALAILPFMVFGAVAEMQMYLGEDESGGADDERHSSGRIVIESLTNVRTVASLSLEETRRDEYAAALAREDPHPFRSNAIKGSTTGLGQFCQNWGLALLYWWGGWLLLTYPNRFPDTKAFYISMFSFLFALSGTGAAAQGATDKDKAQAAADRIFALMERKSEIDPLSTEGKKDI